MRHPPQHLTTPQLVAEAERSSARPNGHDEVFDAAFESVDEAGGLFDATVLRAGLSKNGYFYSDAVLAEAAPKFHGVPIYVRSDAQHIDSVKNPTAARDARALGGWVQNPKFIPGESPNTGRIGAQVVLSESFAGLRKTIAEGLRALQKSLVGLSWVGSVFYDARKSSASKRDITRIEDVQSVDVVVAPSAGGQFIRAVEAEMYQASATPSTPEEQVMWREFFLNAIKARAPAIYASLNVAEATDEQVMTAYSQMQSQQIAEGIEAAVKKVGNGVSREEVERITRVSEARAEAKIKIEATKLPLAAKQRLVERFTKCQDIAEGEVDAAIKAERDYLTSIGQEAHIELNFGDAARVVEGRDEKVAKMFDDFFAKAPGHIRSFRQIYIDITGDTNVTGRLADCNRSRLAESVGSTTFDDSLGNSVTRRMVAEYNATESRYDVYKLLTGDAVPLNDFRSQERPRIGGYGDLPTVAEGAAYAALSSPTDEKATYSPAKRGGTEDITLEAIKNDDVGAIRRIPQKLGRAAKRTLAKFVLDFLRTNPTIYDTLAWFHASHNNLSVNALSAAEVAAARLLLLKQAELNSADRLGIGPKYLWCPWDLQETAVNLFNRSTNNDKTFVQDLALTVVPVWYWTDANDWALSVDTSDMPVIELGFVDGQEEPSLFVQDLPSVGSLFSNDKITYKIKHTYGAAVLDYRGAFKAVVP